MLHYSILGQYYFSVVGFIWKLRLINSYSESKENLWHSNWLFCPLLPPDSTAILKIPTVQFDTHRQSNTTSTVFSALM